MRKAPNLTDLKNLLIQVEDLSNLVDWRVIDLFWRQPQRTDPFLRLCDGFNKAMQMRRILSSQVNKAFMQYAQERGFYPIKLPHNQMIFVFWETLFDIRDELLDKYSAQQKELIKKENEITSNKEV